MDKFEIITVEENMLTNKELKRLTGFSLSRIYRWKRYGKIRKLKPKRLKGKTYFDFLSGLGLNPYKEGKTLILVVCRDRKEVNNKKKFHIENRKEDELVRVINENDFWLSISKDKPYSFIKDIITFRFNKVIVYSYRKSKVKQVIKMLCLLFGIEFESKIIR